MLAARESWSRSQIATFQLERLNAIWAHAIHHVPYYRELAAGSKLPHRFASLTEYQASVPLLEKSVIRSDARRILSEQPEPGEWRWTGGSTGRPMSVFWSKSSHQEMLRCRYRYYDAWNIDIFDRIAYLWGHAASFAPGWRGHVTRTLQPIQDRLRNRLRLSAYRLGSEDLRKHLVRIARFRPASIYGYSRALGLLAAEAEAVRFECDSLKMVTLTAEPPGPSTVANIERVLGVPATIEYGASDAGLIASEAPDRTLRVREDVMLIETLPTSEDKHEIVVSVLNNPSFPLLRYRIGDLTNAPVRRPEAGFAVLENVAGRNSDFLVSKSGRYVHAACLEAFVRHTPSPIRQFRARQFADGSVTVMVSLDSGRKRFDAGQLRERLTELLEGYPVAVELVDTVPCTLAGKHRLVVSDVAAGLVRTKAETGAAAPSREQSMAEQRSFPSGPRRIGLSARVARHLPRFRRAYRDLEMLRTRESWSRTQIETFQLERLNEVWQHARQHVPYYRELARLIRLPERFGSLEEYTNAVPILRKQPVRDRKEAFLSERARKGHWGKTSGSSGTPTAVYWEDAANFAMLRMKYRWLANCGIDIFDRQVFLWGQAATFVGGFNGLKARVIQPLTDRLRNRLRLPAYRLDPESLARYLDEIARFQPAMLYAYPSAAFLLARAAAERKFHCDSLKAIVLSSEPAYPHMIRTMEQAFGVPALNEYGSVECGVLAGECLDRKLHVLDDRVFIETLPREDGQHDIIVTVLDNPGFPLLRYAIQDVSDAPRIKPEIGFSYLGTISGRANDVVVTRDGEYLHPHWFDDVFENVKGVRNWQINQDREGRLTVLVELLDSSVGIDMQALGARIEEQMRGFPVEMRIVDAIPRSPVGKYRWVFSELSSVQLDPDSHSNFEQQQPGPGTAAKKEISA